MTDWYQLLTLLSCSIMHCTVMSWAVHYCAVLGCIMLHCIVLIIVSWLYEEWNPHCCIIFIVVSYLECLDYHPVDSFTYALFSTFLTLFFNSRWMSFSLKCGGTRSLKASRQSQHMSFRRGHVLLLTRNTQGRIPSLAKVRRQCCVQLIRMFVGLFVYIPPRNDNITF